MVVALLHFPVSVRLLGCRLQIVTHFIIQQNTKNAHSVLEFLWDIRLIRKP